MHHVYKQNKTFEFGRNYVIKFVISIIEFLFQEILNSRWMWKYYRDLGLEQIASKQLKLGLG